MSIPKELEVHFTPRHKFLEVSDEHDVALFTHAIVKQMHLLRTNLRWSSEETEHIDELCVVASRKPIIDEDGDI